MRIFARDTHPDVMDFFLWKDEARRILVYAFYDAKGRLQAWWSGRGAEAEQALHETLAGRAYAQLDPEEKLRLGEAFEEGYRRDFRRKNLEEILALLRAFYHVAP